jgi:hypothetical protein
MKNYKMATSSIRGVGAGGLAVSGTEGFEGEAGRQQSCIQ